MWKSRANILTNQIRTYNQSPQLWSPAFSCTFSSLFFPTLFSHPFFPCTFISRTFFPHFLLRVLIGLLEIFPFLWLAVVITLVLGTRHSIKMLSMNNLAQNLKLYTCIESILEDNFFCLLVLNTVQASYAFRQIPISS